MASTIRPQSTNTLTWLKLAFSPFMHSPLALGEEGWPATLPGDGDIGSRCTPRSNDSLHWPPMVAGRLSHFKEAWGRLTDSSFVFQAIDGYLFEFRAQPSFMSHWEAASMKTLFKGQKGSFMDEEVRELLKKGAVEQAPSGAAFYSRIFCVPNKDGRLHSIINLKPLSQFLFALDMIIATDASMWGVGGGGGPYISGMQKVSGRVQIRAPTWTCWNWRRSSTDWRPFKTSWETRLCPCR